ncbi:MAG: cyclase family protein [Acetobacteraceae bacterium]|nr:cyclase family protein [Acetobacteraceae bacterium]
MQGLSRRSLFAACLACGGAHMGLSATPVQAQGQAQSGWSPPPSAQRCPSRFGAADRRGYMNLLDDAKRKAAAAMIQEGKTIELGRRLEATMPFFGTRRFDQHLKRTFMNPEPNTRGSNEEIVISEIGQVGTQLDAFPHQTIGDEIYNCVKFDSIATRGGFREMGVDGIGTVFTRGVMFDIAALKGVRTLPINYEITVADLEGAAQRQEVKIERADAVIINTGWGVHWGADNAQYVRGCPGIGIAAAEWIIRQEPVLIGSDNWPVEVAPNPDRNASLPVHQIALVVHGVHLLENMKLDELAERRLYRFAFMMQPLKIAGGTGSTVAPTALF